MGTMNPTGSRRGTKKITTRPGRKTHERKLPKHQIATRPGRKTHERKAAHHPRQRRDPTALLLSRAPGSPAPPLSRSRKQGLLVRLGICDLVDHEADTALGDDVRNAIAKLDRHHSVRGGDAEHREEVHNGVGAPTDHRHHTSK